MLFIASASHIRARGSGSTPSASRRSGRCQTGRHYAAQIVTLGLVTASRTPRSATWKSSEVTRVRQYSVPARFSIEEHDNVAAVVFEHERDDPQYVIYQRKIDGAWTDVTCAEAADQIRSAALGLIALGVQAGDRVSIFSATCYEWAILDLAILAIGAVTVPIYETSS